MLSFLFSSRRWLGTARFFALLATLLCFTAIARAAGGAPPVINIEPAAASAGDSITLSGPGLAGATKVAFTGLNDRVTGMVQSATGDTVVVKVPAYARNGTIIVETFNDGVAGSVVTSPFTVNASITGLNPPYGREQTFVRIYGTGLSNATAIVFGDVQAVTMGTPTENEATVFVPPGTITAPVTVVTSDAGSAVSAQPFTNTGNVRPTIAPIADKTVATGSSISFDVTIGDYETPAANLNLYPFTSLPQLVPENKIVISGSGANRTVTITPTPGQFGQVDLELVLYDGSGAFNHQAIGRFRLYVTPANVGSGLTVSGFSPSVLQPNEPFTVTGSGFLGPQGPNLSSTTTVWFKSATWPYLSTWQSAMPAEGYTDTSLTVTMPDWTRTGRLAVTVDTTNSSTGVTTRSLAISDTDYIVNATIKEISPDHGDIDQRVYINGTALVNTTQILFNGVPASPTEVSENTLWVRVPAGATTGPLSIVTSDAGTAVSVTDFVVGQNTPPSIAPIIRQTMATNTSKTVNFTVADPDNLDAVTFAGYSDSNMLPPESFVFGGSGANRNVTVTPVPGQFGTATVTLYAYDNSGFENGYSSTDFQILVTPANTGGITITNVSPASALVWDTVVLTGTGFRGPQGPNITNTTDVWFTEFIGPGNPVWKPAGIRDEETTDTRLETAVPQYARTGPIAVTVDSYDSRTDQTTRYVAVSNTDLTISATIHYISPVVNHVGGTVHISGSGLTNTTQVLVNGIPAAIWPERSDSSIVATVPAGATTGLVEVQTWDAGKAVSPQKLIIGSNSAPSINPIDDQTMSMDTTKTVNFTIADAEDVDAVVILAGSDNTNLVEHEDIKTGGSGANRWLKITPKPGVFGSVPITVVADDRSSTSNQYAFSYFRLNILPTGTPGIEINGVSPATVKQGDTVTITGSGFLGPQGAGVSNSTSVWFRGVIPGQGKAQRWIQVTSESGMTDSSLQVDVPQYARTGPIVVTVDSTDGQGHTTQLRAVSSTDLTVNASIFGVSPTEGWGGDTIYLSGSGFQNATGVLVDGIAASSFQINDENNLWAVVPEEAATGPVSVVTSDAGTAVSAGNFVVLPPNIPPTISTISDQTIPTGTETTIPFTVGDERTLPENLQVWGSVSDYNLIPQDRIVFDGEGVNRTITLTPSEGHTGVCTVYIYVYDGRNVTERAFEVTVTPPNQPPTISDIANQGTKRNGATNAISFTVGDPDNAPASLTLSATSSNTTAVPNAGIIFGGSGANRSVTITPAANQSGSATITVTVSDGRLTATDTFVLTVYADDIAPSVTVKAPVNDGYIR